MSFNTGFDEPQASPAPSAPVSTSMADSQQGSSQQQQQQPPQQQQQQQQTGGPQQIHQQPSAQLGGNDFLTQLPIPNPPSATASTSSSPPRTLWMGDLDPWSDEEAVESLWDSMGKRVLVKLIKAKRGTPAANLNTGHAGYCFVEFENYDEAKSALALNGSQIPNTNRVFRLNWASAATLSSTVLQSPEFSLFVGDLSPSTTEAHLLALFQTHFKSVKTVRVMTDPITGTSRCFGFVRFGDEEERRRALTEMSGVWCAGRPLRVALATPRNQGGNMNNNNQNNNGNNQGHLNGAPMGNQFVPPPFAPGQYAPPQPQPQQQQQEMVMYPPYQQVPSMPFFDQDQTSQVSAVPAVSGGNSSVPYTDPNNTTVFVGGLAAGVSEQMLATLFQPFGSIMHIKIPPNKGCGFIRFESREDAVNAINAMQGFAVGGSRIRLSWGRQQNQQRMQMAMMQGGMAPPPPQQVVNGAMMGSGAFVQGQMVPPPVNSMYFVPEKQYGYDQFGMDQGPSAFGGQSMDQFEEKEQSTTPEGGEDGSKLQEMYRAAVAGKLDSLN